MTMWRSFAQMRGDTLPRDWWRRSEFIEVLAREGLNITWHFVEVALRSAPRPERRYGHKHYTHEHLAAVRAFLEAADTEDDEMGEWSMDDVDESPDAVERLLVPECTHTFTIKAAEEGPHKYREGDHLKLRLADIDTRYGLVFCDIPLDKRGATMASSLAKAINGAAFGGKVRLDPDELVGLTVQAEVFHGVSKAGKTYVNVRKFLPAEVEVEKPAPKPPRKAPAAKAIGSDDIPF